MGKAAQRKGRNAEREFSELLNSYGFHTQPGQPLNFGTCADVTGLPGIHLEIKRHEKTSLTEWLRQSQTDADKFHDGIPVVAHRRSRQPWIISMTVENFIQLYKKGFTNE